MVVWRSEGVLSDNPAIRKDNKVCYSHARLGRGTSENREDGRVLGGERGRGREERERKRRGRGRKREGEGGRGREREGEGGRGRGREGEGGRWREMEGEGGRGSDNTLQCRWYLVLHAVSLATHSVVKRHSIDCHEVAKVVLVRIVVSVPCNHIKGRVRLRRQQQQKCHITNSNNISLKIKTTDHAYQCTIMCCTLLKSPQLLAVAD